jgi:hypothetical protein
MENVCKRWYTDGLIEGLIRPSDKEKFVTLPDI